MTHREGCPVGFLFARKGVESCSRLCYDKNNILKESGSKERPRKFLKKQGGELTETEKKKTWSLNRMVVLIMMAGYAALLILLSCMDYYLVADYQNRGREREMGLLSEAAEYVEKAAKDLDEILYDIYAKNKNFEALTVLQEETEEYSNAYELFDAMKSRLFLQENMHGVYIFYGAFQKSLFQCDKEIISFDSQMEIKDRLTVLLSQSKNGGDWQTVVTADGVFRTLTYKRGNVAVCGVFSMNGRLDELERTAGDGAGVSIVEEGMLYHAEGKEDTLGIAAQTKNQEKSFRYWKDNRYVYGRRIENSSMWLCMSIPCRLWTYMNVPQLLLLIVTLFSVLAVYWLYRFIRRELVWPLRDLTETMNRIRQGEWNARTGSRGHLKEIQEVGETLTAMVSEIEKQKMRSYEETIEKQKAQMQYLQLQLKPHFYLNGLKTLNALTLAKDWEKSQELILHISEHLRYLLQTERELVTLGAELNYVRNYIELQKSMTGRPVVCRIREEEGTADYLVPTLCVQTFVENSVKYAKLGAPGRELAIRVCVQRLQTEDGIYLDIMVSDNGGGYPDNILEEINADARRGTRSVGIHNLKRRCALIYEGKAEYNFYNGGGAVSELIVPVINPDRQGIRGEADECIDS